MDSEEDKRLMEYYVGRLKLAREIVVRELNAAGVVFQRDCHTLLIVAVFEKLARDQHWLEEDRKKEELKARYEAQRAVAETAKKVGGGAA